MDLIAQPNTTIKKVYRSEPIYNISEYLFTEEQFNAQDQMVHKKTMSSEGIVIHEEIYKYTMEDSIASVIRKTKEGTEVIQYEYIFDATGRLTQKIAKSHTYQDTYTYQYETDLSFWESYQRNNQVLTNKHFDSQGNLIEEHDHTVQMRATYAYDAKGEVIYSELRFFPDGFIEIQEFEITYDGKGRLSTKLDIHSHTRTEVEYDQQDRITQKTIKSSDNQILQTFRFEYVSS